MTHDELLALVNAKSDSDEVHALRAVVEFHKPEPRLDETLIRKEVLVCGHCWSNKLTWGAAHRYVYPCPTIQSIEKELI